jgi:indole-3-glycerol phosphate synthase
MSYLQEIVQYKRDEIKTLKLADRKREKPLFDSVEHLRKKPFIAEVKKASPSLGDINLGADVVGQARSYEEGGAGAVSVLTDARFFKGSLDYLSDISRAVRLPLLCKDFILSELQVENAYLYGADFILLIAAILSEGEIRLLSQKARDLNMEVLYELHEIEEFQKIKNLELDLVGVNSRDLSSFKISKPKAMETIASLKGGFLKVAESGIETAKDILSFKQAGADAFLVGTVLMTSADPVGKLKEFARALEASCS